MTNPEQERIRKRALDKIRKCLALGASSNAHDVCGSRCGSHVTYTEAGGKEHHACMVAVAAWVIARQCQAMLYA